MQSPLGTNTIIFPMATRIGETQGWIQTSSTPGFHFLPTEPASESTVWRDIDGRLQIGDCWYHFLAHELDRCDLVITRHADDEMLNPGGVYVAAIVNRLTRTHGAVA